MKRILFLSILILSMALTACSAANTTQAATATPVEPVMTTTPDLCSTENLPVEAAKVNKLMREFDDYSALASSTPQNQMVTIIPELQRILRDAEDLQVPPCLIELKKLQITHMSVVVQTLMAFMSSADPNLINAGISKSRELHTQYNIELARLLGLTFTIPPTAVSNPATPDANALQTPPTTASAFTVLNPGPSGVNLRNAPDLNAAEAGVLAVQVVTVALGRTADSLWILVEIPDQPGQTAWVYSTLVQLSVPIEQLAVVTP